MKYGIFGGTFDPFHSGHLSMIKGALDSGAVDEIFVVPAGNPPWKSGNRITPAPYRYYMTCDALSGIKHCRVIPDELLRLGLSYTFDTIKSIKEKINPSKKDEFFLICGTDILSSLENWYNLRELLQEIQLLIAIRPGISQEEIVKENFQPEKNLDARFQYFSIEGIEISSSEIKKNRNYENLPESVASFIQLHNLYPENNPLLYISDEVYEKTLQWIPELFQDLSKRRMLHTLNTALLAATYAHLHKVSPGKAYISGLLHDCAKEFPLNRQKVMAEAMDYFAEEGFESVIHAPAGAYYAKNHFGVKDKEILDAIYYHAMGRKDMTALEKIIFLADKLEPARRYSDLTHMRKLAKEDLDRSLLASLLDIKANFDRNNEPFHPTSNEVIESLMEKENFMEAKKLTEEIAKVLEDKKAVDIEILPVAEKTILAEFFIICSGTSTTHIRSLADDIEYIIKTNLSVTPGHIEGQSTNRWILMDYKDVIVHIFHPEERKEYSLEQLWEMKKPDTSISE